MIPTIIEIPLYFLTLPIHSFGLSMVLTFVGAWAVLRASLSASKQPFSANSAELSERMVTWAAIGGLLGARIWYLLSSPSELFSDPIGAIFGGAGFVFYGGFFGGAFAVWILLRRLKISYLVMSDYVAPALCIGYAIGRVGCQLSGDGDYGRETDLPWGVSYALGVVPTAVGLRVHPTPVYETLYALAIAVILLSPWAGRIFARAGQKFGLYLVLTAACRFLVEILRVEPVVFAGMSQAQVLAIFIAAVGTWMVLRKKRSYVRSLSIRRQCAAAGGGGAPVQPNPRY